MRHESSANEPRLFDETTQGFALWHRTTRREKWKIVGTAPTTEGLLAFMDQVGSGMFVRLPVGQEPGPSRQM